MPIAPDCAVAESDVIASTIIAVPSDAHAWRTAAKNALASIMISRGSPLIPHEFKGPISALTPMPRTVCMSVVIHDELDIDSGTIRVKFGGGHAGHNGLRSICDKLGTRDWFRVRCGIGRPPGRMPVADYVLSLPKKDAADDFAQATDLGCEAALFLIEHGLEKTQQKFN